MSLTHPILVHYRKNTLWKYYYIANEIIRLDVIRPLDEKQILSQWLLRGIYLPLINESDDRSYPNKKMFALIKSKLDKYNIYNYAD